MKVLISIFLFLGLLSLKVSAQGEANNWIFNQFNGITFNSGAPQNFPIPHLVTGGSTVASDSAGNLLFYADGYKVYTRSHLLMENGDGLLGRSPQGCIVFRMPGSQKYYYLFTIGSRIPLYGLRYSIIDIEANNGEGKVIVKNHNAVGGGDAMVVLTATFHQNNRDVWVIARKQDDLAYTFASYLVTPTGISDPIYRVEPKNGGSMSDDQGQMRVSPDGKKLIDCRSANGSYYKFNNATGVITWICKLENYAAPLYIQEFGAEFSPSSGYVYICGPGSSSQTMAFYYLYQFDATANDSAAFISSRKTVGIAPHMINDEGMFGMMQAGSDGKIYGTRKEMANLFIINKPDLPDLSCDFQLDGYNLSSQNHIYLPQFLTSYIQRFYYKGTCEGNTFLFTSNFYPEPDSIRWDFGDGSSNTGLNTSHVYINPGDYTVTATATYVAWGTNGTVVASRDIHVAGLPQPNLGPDLTVCKGTSVQLSPGSFTSYLWNNGTSSPTLTIADTGYYWVEVVNDTGCINRDTLHLSWFRQPTIDEGNLNIAPTTCNAATGAITGLVVDGLQPVTITWKNGGGTILGHDPDLYHLPVDNYFLSVTDSAGCTTQLKTYTIKNVGDSLILSVDRQDSHCSLNNGSITVNATAGLTDMLFYAIDTNNFVANGGFFTGLSPGSYQVWVKDSLGCKKVYDGNPVQVFQLPGPSVQSIIQDEINGQSDGSILISTLLPADSLWYTVNGTTQLNNGLFGGLSAGSYTCMVTDAWGCDTSFVLTLANIPSVRLQAIAGDGSACLGNVAVLPLTANHFNRVHSFQARLSYDQTLVTCQNYLNASPVLSDSLVVELFPTLGEVSLRWKGSSPVSLPNGANLLELSFASVQTGQGAVQWDISPGICIFLDSLGSTLPAEFSPGQVRVYSIPQATITDPGPVCEGSDLLLLSHYQQGTGNGTISYQWTGPDGTNGTDPLFYLDEIQSAQAGHWTLTVSDTNHCQGSASVEVNIIPLPVSGFPADKDTLWFDEMTRLEALPGYASYRWNTGDSTSSVLVTSEGWYRVIMQTEEGCTSSDSLMMLYSFAPFTMPNAFTPDGDGKNDTFRPVTIPEKISSFTMYIYNRWGQLVFSTKDLSTGWDGKINGSPAPLGVYTYIISYSNQAGEERKKTGMVTLVR